MKPRYLAHSLAAISVAAVSFLKGIPTSYAEMETIYVGDMETGDLSQWSTKELPKPDSAAVVPSPTREGGGALMITLNRGDAPGRERAEVMPNAWQAYPNFVNEFKPGEEYRYSFSVLLPSDWVIDNDDEIIFQFHSRPDLNLGETWGNPVFALAVRGSMWELTNRADSRAMLPTGTDPQIFRYLYLSSITPGVWTDWTFQVKWSYGPDGVLQVWKDGQPVATYYGPNTYNDAQGPYLKLGIYKFSWKQGPTLTDHRVLYFDSLQIMKVSAPPP